MLAFCDGGYTTNLPLEDVTGGKAWIAYAYDGEPLEPEHGGPARLLVPHLYFWKSAKWVRGLQALEPRRTPASGSRWATTTTATPGASSATGGTETVAKQLPQARLAPRRGRRDPPRHAAHQEPVARRSGLGGAQSGPARGRSPHRRGRLPGPAQLLHRVGPGGRERRARGRASADGEVSPYLTDELRPGDKLELRGPIGGWFVWEVRRAAPCSWSPEARASRRLMAMIRHRAATGSEAPAASCTPRARMRRSSSRGARPLAASDGSLEVSTPSPAPSPPAGRATPAASTMRCSRRWPRPRRSAPTPSSAGPRRWSSRLRRRSWSWGTTQGV